MYELENYFFILKARFTKEQLNGGKKNIEANIRTLSKKQIEELKSTIATLKDGEFITEFYGMDANICVERFKNYQETGVYETFRETNFRLEKERNFEKHGIPVINEQILNYELYKKAPMLCFDSANLLLNNFKKRLNNYKKFKAFTIPLVAHLDDKAYYLTEEEKQEELGNINREQAEAEENYKVHGITETNFLRKERLLREKNNFEDISSLQHDSDRAKFNFYEFGLACTDWELEDDKYKNLEIKINYKNFGLPETDYEKLLREKFEENIEMPKNFDSYKEYFAYTLLGIAEFRKHEWNQKRKEYKERKKNLKNSDIPESDFEKQFREETELNIELFGKAETMIQKDQREEIAFNTLNYGVSCTNEELISFYEYTKLIKNIIF